jgi:hypothetical protein
MTMFRHNLSSLALIGGGAEAVMSWSKYILRVHGVQTGPPCISRLYITVYVGWVLMGVVEVTPTEEAGSLPVGSSCRSVFVDSPAPVTVETQSPWAMDSAYLP